MDELVLTGGRLADPERGTIEPGDLAVRDGRIARTGPPGTLRGRETLDATGLLITPGLIDLHTHVYPGRTGLGVPADSVGVDQGVTTVADAGSCGSDDWADFRRTVVGAARTRCAAGSTSPGTASYRATANSRAGHGTSTSTRPTPCCGARAPSYGDSRCG